MRRRALLTTVPAFILGVFVVTGIPFLTMASTAKMSAKIKYSADDVNTITESKVRKEHYEYYIAKEANYTFNNAATMLAVRGGTKDPSPLWRSDKTYGELKETLKDIFLNEETFGLKEQNRLKGCQKPDIKYSDISFERPNKIKIGLKGKGVKCVEPNSIAKVYFEEDIVVEAKNNSYLQAIYWAEKIENRFLELVSEKEWEKKNVKDVEYQADPDPENPEKKVKQKAKSWAREKIKSGVLPSDKFVQTAVKDVKSEKNFPSHFKIIRDYTRESYEIKASAKNVEEAGTTSCGPQGNKECEVWQADGEAYLKSVTSNIGIEDTQHKYIDSESVDGANLYKKTLEFAFKKKYSPTYQ